MKPLISVVLSVRNGAAFLGEALASLFNQTMHELEVVVIDDGSTDETPGVLETWRRTDQRLRIRRQGQRGLAQALNLGCSEVTSGLVARMDADDIAFPDRLRLQYDYLQAHPEVAMVGGAIVLMAADGTTGATVKYPSDGNTIRALLPHRNAFAHPTVLVRREALEAVGGYRPALEPSEDYDLWLRLSERYQLSNLMDPVLYHRVHDGQVSHRQLEAEVASFLMAQALAKQRQSGGEEVVIGEGPVTADRLAAVGVDAKRMWELLDRARRQSARLRSAGKARGQSERRQGGDPLQS